MDQILGRHCFHPHRSRSISLIRDDLRSKIVCLLQSSDVHQFLEHNCFLLGTHVFGDNFDQIVLGIGKTYTIETDLLEDWIVVFKLGNNLIFACEFLENAESL